MSRKNHTPIAQDKLVLIMQQAGLECKANKGWLKFYPKGQGIKRALGVPTTKQCTIIEIVGFTTAIEGVVPHPKPPAKTVEQMVDFQRDEKLVLRTVFELAKSLASLSASPVASPVASPTDSLEVLSEAQVQVA